MAETAEHEEFTEDAPLTDAEKRRRSNRDAQRRYRQRLSTEEAAALRLRASAQRRRRYAEMAETKRADLRAAGRARYAADAERQRAGAKRRYLANRAKRRAQHRAWKAEHPARVRELARRSGRAWRRRNPAQARAIHAAYRERHRERFRLYWRQRKSRSRGALCLDTAAHREYASILLADPCSYCGSEAMTIDHIVAIARGGSDEWDNLTAACGACNSAKHARPLLEALL